MRSVDKSGLTAFSSKTPSFDSKNAGICSVRSSVRASGAGGGFGASTAVFSAISLASASTRSRFSLTLAQMVMICFWIFSVASSFLRTSACAFAIWPWSFSSSSWSSLIFVSLPSFAFLADLALSTAASASVTAAFQASLLGYLDSQCFAALRAFSSSLTFSSGFAFSAVVHLTEFPPPLSFEFSTSNDLHLSISSLFFFSSELSTLP